SKSLKLDEVVANKWFAAILILIGISALWNNIFNIVCKYIPEAIWDDIYPIISAIPGAFFAILIIIAGIMLVKEKKKSITDEDTVPAIEDKSM
ncbi:MAG: hypothetical protein IK123_10515, partial [Lachnospiraceae bacterium]|nr:hypothetical protein [Lachnospiraceae bacterium]